MNIWLHRISHHSEFARPLLEKGILTIGFSDFSDEGFPEKVRNQGIAAIDQACRDNSWPTIPKSRYSLLKFLVEMQKGDWILVPGPKVFSIYIITGEKPKIISEIDIKDISDISIKIGNDKRLYDLSGEKYIDLGFFWEVKILKRERELIDIPRAVYADALLTSRMKILSTNAKISDLEKSIEDAINRFERNQPINLYAQIIESTVPTITEAFHKNLTPDKFEKLIKWYFRRIGASEVYIPAKNESKKEGDADVIATFEPIKTIIYIQAKFHIGETDSWALEQVLAYKNFKEEADSEYSKLCWVITTGSSYSSQALEIAKQNEIQLFDEKTFAMLLLEAGVNGMSEALK